jgi:hypothetical protein
MENAMADEFAILGVIAGIAKPPIEDVRSTVAIGGKADMAQIWSN